MPNMSYCRFRNTNADFADCIDALDELDFGEAEPLSYDEFAAANDLLIKAVEIAQIIAEAQCVDADYLDETHVENYLRDLQRIAQEKTND